MKYIIIICALFFTLSIIAFNVDETGSNWIITNEHYYDIYFMCSTKNIRPSISSNFMIEKHSTIAYEWPQILPGASWNCTGYDLISEAGISFIDFESLTNEIVKLMVKTSGSNFKIQKD